MGIKLSDVKNPALREKLAKAAGSVTSPYTSIPEVSKSTSKFVSVPGLPIGKPRMTQRDRWQKRDVVIRYRDYCDRIRAEVARQVGELPPLPDEIRVVAFLPVPESWSKAKKHSLTGSGHRSKPDGDNILKGICDALLQDDSCLWSKWVRKYWCEPGDECTEITVLYLHS